MLSERAEPLPLPAPAPLRVNAVRDFAGLARLRAEWDALHEASAAGPFNAWAWLYPWAARLGRARSLWVLEARDSEGALAGLLPLGLSTVSRAGVRARRLAFLGDAFVGSDYLDVVARPGVEAQVARTFAQELVRTAAEWDVLELLDIDAGSPVLSELRQSFGASGFEVEERFRYVCPFEALTPGEPFERFLQRTARRDNYLRRRRWLERQPGYRIEVAARPEELAQPLAELFRLHALRWAGEGGSQGIRGAAVEAFHREAAWHLAEDGRVRLYTLRIGDRAVASVYGLVHGGRFHYYQSGLDPAWNNRSVGLVLVGETFRDAIALGLTGYDFLHGNESYKADWVHGQKRTVEFRAWKSGGAGEWLNRAEAATRAARRLAERVAPRAWVEAVRRRRRTARVEA